MAPNRPVPAHDPDTWGFFEAAARGELVVNACGACGAVLHLPRPYCHHCGSFAVEWRPVSGHARLVSWTTVHRGFHPAFETPYAVVLVELDDAPGVRLAGHLVGDPELVDGMAMQVRFEHIDDDVVLPQWTPAATGELD
jgi:uncharacterized OB-fold protein